jgi:hypothetical protein
MLMILIKRQENNMLRLMQHEKKDECMIVSYRNSIAFGPRVTTGTFAMRLEC